MAIQLIIFINGYVYELDTIEKTLVLISQDDDYIPFTTYPIQETNAENFIKKNPKYKIIEDTDQY